jgi:hypothetical protein
MRKTLASLLFILLAVVAVPSLQAAASVAELTKAAEQGDAASQYGLAQRYEAGKGVKQDFAKAAEWYGKAAAQGHAKAQTNLGNLYRAGQGVSQDLDEALLWYRKAAGQGDTKAQINLAMMYATGTSVEKDEAEGLRWLQRAAHAGDNQAKVHLEILCRPGKGVGKALPRTDTNVRHCTATTPRVQSRESSTKRPIIIPWFVLGFIVATGINSLIDIPAIGLSGLHLLSQLCLALAMTALGMQTQWHKLKHAGIKSLLLALILFVLLLLGGFGLNQLLIQA